jgi:hypothetical protein
LAQKDDSTFGYEQILEIQIGIKNIKYHVPHKLIEFVKKLLKQREFNLEQYLVPTALSLENGKILNDALWHKSFLLSSAY